MRSTFAILTILILVASVVALPENGNDVYLVKSHRSDLKSKYGIRHDFNVGFTTRLSAKGVRDLKAQGVDVERVPLYHVTKPPGKCDPWPECNKNGGGESERITPSDQIPWGIEIIYNDIGLASTSGGSGIDVAVLDTGVDVNHPDLKRRVVQCVDFTKGPFPKNRCKDGNGHGTHVSGTILADAGSDGLGVYGVAPEANLLSYKVCDDTGSCWSDDIAAGIDYAGSHGADIISISIGGDSESSLIRDAISRNTHVLFVAAAGNDGPGSGSIDYPGANINVIAVGAIDANEDVPSWSSRGVNDGDFVIEEREVELGAPGVSVESTWINGGYRIISGTSMATPHVSGLAAKLWQGDATLTRNYLQNRAKLHDLSTPGDDPATGFGLPTVG